MKCGCRETQKSRISLTSNHFGKSWQHVNSSHINYSEPGTLIPGLCCHLGLLMKENAQGNTERSSQCDTAWNSSITKLAVKIWDRGWTPNSKEVTKVLHAVRKKRKKKKKTHTRLSLSHGILKWKWGVGGVGGESGKNNTFVTPSHFLYRIQAKPPAPLPQTQMVIVYSKGAQKGLQVWAP